MGYELPYRLRAGLLSCAVLAASSTGFAQGSVNSQARELHGEVKRSDGTPFTEGALVKIEIARGGMAAEVRTDSRGKFDIISLQKSWYIVTVQAPGFRDATVTVDLDTLPRQFIHIALVELPPSDSEPPSLTASSGILSVNDLNVPQAAQSEFEKGRKLLVDKHNPGDSVKAFLKAIQIAPSYSHAHLMLGTAYLALGKWSDAEAAYNKAISINENLGPAYFGLGSCLIEEKKFVEAEKPLLRGLELVPDTSSGHYDLGRTYFALSRFSEAEVQARKTISLAPNFPEGHILLGNILLRLREGAQALVEFQEYLKLDPNGAFAGPAQELVKKLQAGLSEAN